MSCHDDVAQVLTMRASDTPVFQGEPPNTGPVMKASVTVPHVATLPLWSPLGPPAADWRLERKRTHFPPVSL